MTRASNRTAQAASQAPAAAECRHVLVVDDDPAIRATIAQILLFEGHHATLAPDGGAALDLAAARLPDVVLLDYHMPRVAGPEFVRRFRAAHGRRVPLILMTAANDAPLRCREVDADGCLGKPFDLEDLLAVVALPRHEHAA
jgi:CheY-like chemotaxis protein